MNIFIGELILKKSFGLTDEELVDLLSFDVRFQYVPHTKSFEEQPLNDRTFWKLLCTMQCIWGTDRHRFDPWLHFISFSSQMAEMMHFNSGLRRMDSLMVTSNIKKMSRLELLYICVANLVNILHKAKNDKLTFGTAIPL